MNRTRGNREWHGISRDWTTKRRAESGSKHAEQRTVRAVLTRLQSKANSTRQTIGGTTSEATVVQRPWQYYISFVWQ